MGKIYFSKNIGSDAVKYRDGLWIPYRKRNYVYWYNFLQHAERSSHHKVNWNKYKGWGGANYVLGTKFNDFWEEKWKELFGLKNKNDEQKYPFRIQPKTDGIRLSLLCWEQRSKLKDPNKKGQVIEIARKVYQYETGLSGEKRPRYYQGEFDVSQINPDMIRDDFRERESKMTSAEQFDEEMFNQEFGKKEIDEDKEHTQYVQRTVSRMINRGKRIISNVCKGHFP